MSNWSFAAGLHASVTGLNVALYADGRDPVHLGLAVMTLLLFVHALVMCACTERAT